MEVIEEGLGPLLALLEPLLFAERPTPPEERRLLEAEEEGLGLMRALDDDDDG